ncbi:MAG: AMIN domain-containing protein, partial [Gammaproteobacteria bacterium]
MNANLMTWNAMAQGTRFLQRLAGNAILALATLCLLSGWQYARAEAVPLNALQEISYAGLPGNQVQVIFTLSQPVSSPASFTIDNPARIAFDLPATKSELATRSQPIGIGPAKSVTAVEVKGRTRVVLNLLEMVPYETRTEGNRIVVVLG